MFNCVNFIDKDDVRWLFFGLFKYIVDMGSINIYEYFNKVRIWYGKKWYFGFIGNGFG